MIITKTNKPNSNYSESHYICKQCNEPCEIKEEYSFIMGNSTIISTRMILHHKLQSNCSMANFFHRTAYVSNYTSSNIYKDTKNQLDNFFNSSDYKTILKQEIIKSL